jgi:hypothetical protein
MARTRDETYDFGEKVEGIDIPVFNERAVRASAGILFLLGFSAVSYAFFTGDFQPVRGFAILFLWTWEFGLGSTIALHPLWR